MRRPTHPPRLSPPVRAGVLVLCLALPGCKLIDQRTFERTGSGPSQASLARSAALARQAATKDAAPLLTVRPGDLDNDWRPGVLAAVDDALARQPDASFDIVAPFPTSLPEAAQKQAIATGAADSEAVASAIEANGVAADKLHLSARGDSGRPGRVVEIFLRPAAQKP